MNKMQAAIAAFVALSVVPLPSLAEPPAHAKAHGWRKKNDPSYPGYMGRKWDKDYGILDGRCNAKAVGAVLGGAVGGVIGSQVGEGDNRPVAILVGTALGAILGAKIGADMDAGDRGCMGHALELAGDGKPVRWNNAATGVVYTLTPVRDFESRGQPCREFTTVAKPKNKDRGERVKGVACRRANGEWELRS